MNASAMLTGLLCADRAHVFPLLPTLFRFFGVAKAGVGVVSPQGLTAYLRTTLFHALCIDATLGEEALGACDEISPVAQRVSAVTVVSRRADGTLFGDNTDVEGFRQCFAPLLERKTFVGMPCCVCGEGPRARAAVAALEDFGAQVSTADETSIGSGARFIVQAPARSALVRAHFIGSERELPEVTFYAAALFAASRRYMGGTLARKVYLYGPPGVGKTYLSRRLAPLFGYRLYDLDEQVTNAIGQPISAYFAKEGEAAFRQRELESLTRLAAYTHPCLVSLGGGSLLNAETCALAQASGRIVLVELPREAIWRHVQAAPGKRPLAQDEAAFDKLMEQRKDHYERFRI